MAESAEREAFNELVELLRKHRLDWLVEETLADIAVGKTEKRILKKMRKGQDEYQRVVVSPSDFKETRGRTEFLTSEPFSEHEQLARLVSAVENTLVESADMEAEIVTIAEREVVFADTDDQGEREPDIESAAIKERKSEAADLKRLLHSVLKGDGEQQ